MVLRLRGGGGPVVILINLTNGKKIPIN